MRVPAVSGIHSFVICLLSKPGQEIWRSEAGVSIGRFHRCHLVVGVVDLLLQSDYRTKPPTRPRYAVT